MPINLSIEYPKLVNENMKLRYQNDELVKALQDILELPQTIGHAYQMQDIAKEALKKTLNKKSWLLIKNLMQIG